MNTIQHLIKHQLIKPPKFLADNVQYETIMGSVAYGVSSDTSDMDIYGYCIPPKEMVFPHLQGEIYGFGRQINRFEQYQEHHIEDTTALAGKGRNYDVSIYNIVKYFQLCMENNPNMIDSLFTPHVCVLTSTQVSQMVREQKNIFLHKGSWHKFKGYAYAQVHKMKNKVPESGKRKELIEKFGYDTKFAYHVVRLLNEVEQIMTDGTIDLQKNNEQLKSIRRGDWKEQEIYEYFSSKERELETLYQNSKLQHSPDESKIKQLLMQCLEHHYGNIDDCVMNVDKAKQAIDEVKAVLYKFGYSS